MERVSDERLQVYVEHKRAAWEAADIQAMARELLELRDDKQAWSHGFKAMHKAQLKIQSELLERLAAAERVINLVRHDIGNGLWIKSEIDFKMARALEAYDKVKNDK